MRLENPELSRVGGAVIDGLRLTWPLATFSATRTAIGIRTVFGSRYVIPRAELKHLRLAWKHFWPSLEIVHGAKGVPRDLWFLPLNRRRLVRDLQRLGYDVMSS